MSFQTKPHLRDHQKEKRSINSWFFLVRPDYTFWVWCHLQLNKFVIFFARPDYTFGGKCPFKLNHIWGICGICGSSKGEEKYQFVIFLGPAWLHVLGLVSSITKPHLRDMRIMRRREVSIRDFFCPACLHVWGQVSFQTKPHLRNMRIMRRREVSIRDLQRIVMFLTVVLDSKIIEMEIIYILPNLN